MKWIEEKENLEKLIKEEKHSYEEVGRMYGITGAAIKKACKKLGIELEVRRIINECEHFNKIKKKHNCLNCGTEFDHKVGYTNKYCCVECEKEYKHKQKYNKILVGDESIMRANYDASAYKKDIIEEQNGICAICGMKPEWNNKPLVFILDHIDGNAANNIRSNLRCVCPNCDSQLDTYKSKNKNGARSYYRYHKYDEKTKIGK